jgi:hypothetical protein
VRIRIILIFILAIGAVATVVLWRRPASAPVLVAVSESGENAAQVFAPEPAATMVEPTQSNPTRSISAPVSPPTTEEVVAQLLAEIQGAFAATNLGAREFALTNLLPALVIKDAPAAAHLAQAITEVELRETALRRVAQLWAAQDSAGALTWAAALTDADERDAALTDVCRQVARSDLPEAIRLREQFVIDDRPDPALENLAQQWAEKDLSAALIWTLARAQGDQRDQLIARVAFIQSQTAPEEAARLAVEQIPPGETQNEAAISVLHQWALRDLAAATSWVERFPDGPLRERAVLELSSIAGLLQANAP